VHEGARVVFSDLLNEKGKSLEEEIGKNVTSYRADATSASETEALMKFALERFGRLDCVVNNTGEGGEGGPIAENSVEGFDRSIGLLLRGTFLGIKYGVTSAKRRNHHHQHRLVISDSVCDQRGNHALSEAGSCWK
jgi:NAD(P)-dependent dehydrogenase (short-subunit alcohol dehydrogenase family)